MTEEPTEEERARVGEGMAVLVAELRERGRADDDARKAQTSLFIAEATQRAFKRDCVAHGVDPDGLASPALLKLLGFVPDVD